MMRPTASLTLAAMAIVPMASTVTATEPAAATRTIEIAATIETDAATLYRLWTTSDGVRTLFPGADATIGEAVGGEYRVVFDPAHPDGSVNGTAGCKIRALEPDRRLIFEWRGPSWADEMNVTPLPTWVEVDFAPADGGTAVSLRHHGFGEGDGWDRSFDYFTGAWTRTLHGLRQRFAAMPELRPSDDGGEPLFVFILRPGPAWDAAKALHEQTRIFNHAAYLGALAERGVMPMAGPFADLDDHRTGHLAIGVLRAPDLAVAERFLRADPAIQAGTFLYELRPWSATLPAAE